MGHFIQVSNNLRTWRLIYSVTYHYQTISNANISEVDLHKWNYCYWAQKWATHTHRGEPPTYGLSSFTSWSRLVSIVLLLVSLPLLVCFYCSSSFTFFSSLILVCYNSSAKEKKQNSDSSFNKNLSVFLSFLLGAYLGSKLLILGPNNHKSSYPLLIWCVI